MSVKGLIFIGYRDTLPSLWSSPYDEANWASLHSTRCDV